MRWIELALFATPFVAYAAWQFAGPRARRWVLPAAFAVVVALGGAAVVVGEEDRVLPGERYVPARVEDGRVVPGHAAPR